MIGKGANFEAEAMDMSLHLQRPLNCGTLFGDRGCVKFKSYPFGRTATSASYQVITLLFPVAEIVCFLALCIFSLFFIIVSSFELL